MTVALISALQLLLSKAKLKQGLCWVYEKYLGQAPAEVQMTSKDLSSKRLTTQEDEAAPRFNMPLDLGIFVGAKRSGLQDLLLFGRAPHFLERPSWATPSRIPQSAPLPFRGGKASRIGKE